MAEELRPLVLIVEDDRAVATLIGEALAERGFQTLVAGDANSALQHLECLQPALLTLDLGLPGISGPTLLQLIRAQWPADLLPIVVVTAHPHLDPAVCEQTQAVLRKPFDLEVLQAIVSAWCELSQPVRARTVGAQ